jgi:hypothetical protein
MAKRCALPSFILISFKTASAVVAGSIAPVAGFCTTAAAAAVCCDLPADLCLLLLFAMLLLLPDLAVSLCAADQLLIVGCNVRFCLICVEVPAH